MGVVIKTRVPAWRVEVIGQAHPEEYPSTLDFYVDPDLQVAVHAALADHGDSAVVLVCRRLYVLREQLPEHKGGRGNGGQSDE